MVEITKIEDISICVNDTDCNKSIDSTIYIQIPEVDTSSEDLSNETEEINIFTTTNHTEISSKINASATELSEVPSTLTTTLSPSVITISSSTIRLSDNENLTLKEKEICECDLTNFLFL
ncbi:PREDICTED: uncharacterized protein LOC105557020 isoform X2 [Vollenhovia emeryi]|uniref:uncharacterized protein LOC105557020 isoform X2 n=1 Tax=Vollenhovia emeryi TaxID=411798 RepID=UPI0005F3ACF7|nr:PREDICTED: uncharacterized protein LOC105557020 isoform X2 [Vollenhovia emeryi]